MIRASVAALAAETMEPEYFEAIDAHKQGTIGKRGVDLFGVFFGQTVDAISQHDHDVLGDLFQSSISYGENAFFMTPQPIGTMMARMMSGEAEEIPQNARIHDPCCGTGILLIEAGKERPDAELCGTDVDARCADITAINLGLRSHYGWVICGNSLSRKVNYAYRIGHFYHEGPNGLRRGVVRRVDPKQCPVLPELQGDQRTGLFTEEKKEPTPEPTGELPKIIEFPRYVLKLEMAQRLAAQPTTQQNPAPSQNTAQNPPDEDGPKRQGQLF